MNPEINMTPLSSEIINIEEQTVIEIENNTENFKDDNSTTDTEQSDISDPIIEYTESELKRAEAYSKAGADAILIHSKENTPKQIFNFAKKFTKSKFYKPMVAVPSSYSKTTEAQLIKAGFKVVIYANHMQRAAYPAMQNAAKSILKNKRSFELEKNISSVNEVINLIK